MNEEIIVITKKEYFNLKVDSEILSRLQSGGVHDWEWYGEALNQDGEKKLADFKEELKKELGI